MNFHFAISALHAISYYIGPCYEEVWLYYTASVESHTHHSGWRIDNYDTSQTRMASQQIHVWNKQAVKSQWQMYDISTKMDYNTKFKKSCKYVLQSM